MAKKNPCKHKGKKVLLVEGKSDCHVILALCEYHHISETFGIYECENDEALLKRLNALIIQPLPPETIGVVMDTDDSGASSRWQQIQQKIKDHGYLFPEMPNEKGSILPDNSGKPLIGIWLMPNNQDPGMLEDFLMEMAEESAMNAASQCVETAKQGGFTHFKQPHYSKAIIHTYLAWQDEPGKPLGQSVTAHALRPDTEIALIFVEWLSNLFKE
ncbi:conserved hypothetical protein [Desulfamplus magnetovallimortis]|uniref:DUF4435 domain-containing protein n=1 Tax=Desulfamplus magnetovallimortis TaxID=1246637 RepID=A0A1W1H674_9BACT|nr:DUF3226 domain-containing protein [Desulfamplus magnetovallimortis]SLM27990.1 conserved hypothetical protein [Desulfamplus magnetovallimortis]